jgi:hypothetical protein
MRRHSSNPVLTRADVGEKAHHKLSQLSLSDLESILSRIIARFVL